MSKTGIYAIINLKNGKLYIGSAVNYPERWATHRWQLNANKHDNIHLQRAWNKYGKENFCFKLVEQLTNKEELLAKEQHYINEMNSYDVNFGYNICKIAGSTLGIIIDEIGRANMRKKKPSGFGEKISLLKRGKPLSNTHKAAIGRAHTGQKRTHEARIKMSLVARQRVIDETKRRKALA